MKLGIEGIRQEDLRAVLTIQESQRTLDHFMMTQKSRE